MIACFDTEQPSVRIVEQGKVYVFIALNGRWVNRQVENGQEPQTCWECDYAEIVCEKEQIDLGDVRENPAKYLNWEPVTPDTAAVMMRMIAAQYAVKEAEVAEYEAALAEIAKEVGV